MLRIFYNGFITLVADYGQCIQEVLTKTIINSGIAGRIISVFQRIITHGCPYDSRHDQH